MNIVIIIEIHRRFHSMNFYYPHTRNTCDERRDDSRAAFGRPPSPQGEGNHVMFEYGWVF